MALSAAGRLVSSVTGQLESHESVMMSLVLLGPTGVGKTHLAAGVVNAIRRRTIAEYEAAKTATAASDGRWPQAPRWSEWINVADAIVSIRLEFALPSRDRETTTRVIGLRDHDGLLVLDDLGREKASDWTGELVYALVNARYEARLPTLVTTNLTSADLAASPYWPAISRLAEDGQLVRVDAPDRRLRKER
jgi:DNA replication protein DnaC